MKLNSFILVLLSMLLLNTINNAQGQNWKDEISSYYFYIKVAGSDKFWDLPGKHPNTAKRGVQFQIWSNDEDKYEKTFSFPGVTNTDYFVIQNLAGYIADISGKKELNLKEEVQKKAGKKFDMKKDNGAKIQTWEVGSKGVEQWQQWKLIIVDKNTVIFENVFTKKAIEIEGGVENIDRNGAKLISWERHNGESQRFQLVYADGPMKGKLLDFEK